MQGECTLPVGNFDFEHSLIVAFSTLPPSISSKAGTIPKEKNEYGAQSRHVPEAENVSYCDEIHRHIYVYWESQRLTYSSLGL